MDYFLSKIMNLQPETLQLKTDLPCVKFFRIVSLEKTSMQLLLFHIPCKTDNSEISFETFTAMQMLNLYQTPSWRAFDLKACFNKRRMKVSIENNRCVVIGIELGDKFFFNTF